MHASPSLQPLPFAFSGFEQVPLVGLQVPATWHWSLAKQTTGFAPVQTPVWQVSLCVQALPSLQVLPFALSGFEQVPCAGSQVPATWHWSLAAQTTGFAPVQTPASQVSLCVQALPSSQVLPFVLFGFEQVPVDWSHVPTS